MKKFLSFLSGVFCFAYAVSAVQAAEFTVRSGGAVSVPEKSEIYTEKADLDQIMTEVSGQPDEQVEAVWFSDRGAVYYENTQEGFVKLDDWDEMDADALMEAYVEGAKEQSKLMGETITPLGWAIEPTLAKDKALAYYSLEVKFGEAEPIVNMVIYKFGRFGYEEITLATAADAVPPSEALQVAEEVAASYHFGKEASYDDFQEGDKIAAVGAAGLIAAAFGAKLGKAGLFVVALAFLKKFWFLLLAPLAGLWGFIKRRLSA